MSKTLKSENSKNCTNTEDGNVSEEISDNEEVLFELDECLHSKDATLNELKEKVTNLEKDIKRYTTPYNSQTSTLENDINMFRTIASKYVKSDLIDFYVERMLESDKNSSNDQSTLNILCQTLSKDGKSSNAN